MAAAGLSVATAVGVYLALRELADFLGLPFEGWADAAVMSIGGGGRHAYEFELGGGWTDIGVYALLISLMLAWRLYQTVISASLHGGLSSKRRAAWWAWALGLTLYACGVGVYLWLDLPLAGLGMARLASLIAAYFFGTRLHHRLQPFQLPLQSRQAEKAD